MFEKVGKENETLESRTNQNFYLPMAPIDKQSVRAFRDEKNDMIYHVCLINSEEISPNTVRDQ